MAMTFSVYNVTSSTADLYITNMNDYYTEKKIIITLNGTSTTDYFTAGAMRIYNLTGLSSSTYYSITVQIQYYVDGWGWESDGSASDSFTTSSGGGEEEDDPSFTAEIYNNNNIYVQISDLIHYDRTYFYLWHHGDHSSPIAQSSSNWNALYYDFQNLSSGYYDISVEYRYNEQYHQIYTTSGWEYFSLQITGGGGSTSWSYPTTDWISNINNNINETYSINQYEGVKILISFTNAETVTFSVSGQAACEIYLTGDATFDPDTGIPINSGGTYYGGGSQITNISVEASPRYYIIWIKGINEQVSGNVTLTINLNVTPPSSDSYVYIYTGSGSNQGWKKAIPYIYTGSGSNQGWKQAQVYIFNGISWKKTTE